MAFTTVLLFSGLLLASLSCAQRRKRPPPPANPIDKISAQANFDPSQFAGKWFLVGVASRCNSLRENSHRLEPTNMVVSVTGAKPLNSLVIHTLRPMDGICWNLKQIYFPANTPGRFLLKGRSSPVDVVVGETDYSSHAVVYYQKLRQMSMKLYGRTIRVSDSVMAKFEQLVSGAGLNEDLTYYFPTYGFCDSADQFHVLDETKAKGAP